MSRRVAAAAAASSETTPCSVILSLPSRLLAIPPLSKAPPRQPAPTASAFSAMAPVCPDFEYVFGVHCCSMLDSSNICGSSTFVRVECGHPFRVRQYENYNLRFRCVPFPLARLPFAAPVSALGTGQHRSQPRTVGHGQVRADAGVPVPELLWVLRGKMYVCYSAIQLLSV